MTTTSVERGAIVGDRAVATLVTAFCADPVMRWVLPNASRYLAHFPEIVRLFAGPAFEAGSVDCAPDDGGAALWVPPGAAPVDDDAAGELLGRSVDAGRQQDVLAFLSQMAEHHPVERHWYLQFMGVDTNRQGQGLGSALLERGLARGDRDALPAYLEASSPRNRALYERHGFTVTGEIQAGDSPPMWPMWRPAR